VGVFVPRIIVCSCWQRFDVCLQRFDALESRPSPAPAPAPVPAVAVVEGGGGGGGGGKDAAPGPRRGAPPGPGGGAPTPPTPLGSFRFPSLNGSSSSNTLFRVCSLATRRKDNPPPCFLLYIFCLSTRSNFGFSLTRNVFLSSSFYKFN